MAPVQKITQRYDVPTAELWAALTEPERLSAWLMPPRDFTLEEGGRFVFDVRQGAHWDGEVTVELAEIEPGKKLVWHWRVKKRWTKVTLEISEPEPGTSLLVLTHQGFQGAMGWLLSNAYRGSWLKDLTRRLPRHLADRRAEAGTESA